MSANTNRECTTLVLGGGPGGYVAALRAATLGGRVILAEPNRLGGVCLQEGCVPSKAMLHAGELLAQTTATPWLTGTVDVQIDVPAMQAWKNGIIDRLTGGIGRLLGSRRVEVITARGRLTSPHTADLIDADRHVRTVRFDSVVLATGAEAVALPGLPFDGKHVLNARDVLALQSIPSRTVVVGAGFVGLELGGMLADLGSKVTIVEAADVVLPMMEPTIVDILVRAMRARGIAIHTGTRVQKVLDGTVSADGPDGPLRLDADAVVVAIGRRPVTHDLGLDAAGLTPTTSGHLAVDKAMRTGTPTVFAIGDLTSGPALAHRAMAQGRIAGSNAAGKDEHFAPASVAAVVYTRPELVSVGLTSVEARTLGIDAVASQFPLSANARALTLGVPGLGVLVSERGTGLLLGVHLAGPQVSELAATAAVALEMGAVAEDLADTVLPHPTVSESLAEMAEAALGLGVHAHR